MAAKKSSPTFEFTRNYLEKRPDAEFSEVAAAAQKKNLKVIPVVYGRAKKLLGLAKPAASSGAGARRVTGGRRGRAPQGASLSGPALNTLEGAILAMRRNDAERERFRKALESIRDLADQALAE